MVAATGTGKTVAAALDYRRPAEDPIRRAESAVRRASQARSWNSRCNTYREVLADATFGETFVAGSRPEQWRHVFASIQSLSSHGVERLPPDHSRRGLSWTSSTTLRQRRIGACSTICALRELLGPTATPERADGVDVRAFFDNRTAYEQRLWDALSDNLLVPFHYFGVADDVDLRGIEWKRGTYDRAGLDRVYTGNDARH